MAKSGNSALVLAIALVVVVGSVLAAERVVAASNEFTVLFARGAYSNQVVDEIVATYNCTAVRLITERIALFTLPNEVDGEEVAQQCMAEHFQGVDEVAGVPVYAAESSGPDKGTSPSCDELSTCMSCIEPPEGIRVPNRPGLDPETYRQWYLNDECLEVVDAWEFGRGADPNVTLVIIDSGIDLSHEEFAPLIGNRIQTISFTEGMDVPEVSDPVDDLVGHGTRLAGIAFAPNNGVGISGIAPEANALVCDITYQSPTCVGITSQAIWIEAIDYIGSLALANPTHKYVVCIAYDINITYGTPVYWTGLTDAMDKCAANDNVIFIAAMGNDHPACQDLKPKPFDPGAVCTWAAYPAQFSGPFEGYAATYDRMTIAVGGVTYFGVVQTDTVLGVVRTDTLMSLKQYDKTNYANSPDTCQVVTDVCAPSGGAWNEANRCENLAGTRLGIYTTMLDGGYGYAAGGTSYSTAMVAGVTALAWARNPSYSASDIKRLTVEYADNRTWSIDHPGYKVLIGEGVGLSVGWGLHRSRATEFFHHDCTRDHWPSLWPNSNDKNVPVENWPDFDAVSSKVLGAGIPKARDIVTDPGSGVVYRIFGGPINQYYDLRDAKVIRVYGDATIGAGGELDLSDPSMPALFSVYEGDLEAAGEDTQMVEIAVADGGRITFSGSGITFDTSDLVGGADRWTGLRVGPGGTISSGGTEGLNIGRAASVALRVEAGGVVDVDRLVVASTDTGIVARGYLGATEILADEVQSVVCAPVGGDIASSGTLAITARQSPNVKGMVVPYQFGVQFAGLAVSGAAVGLEVVPAANIDFGSSLLDFESCAQGLVLGEGAEFSGNEIGATDCGSVCVDVGPSATLNLGSGLLTSATGVFLRPGARIVVADSLVMSRCTYGVVAVGTAGAVEAIRGTLITSDCLVGVRGIGADVHIEDGAVVVRGGGDNIGVMLNSAAIEVEPSAQLNIYGCNTGLRADSGTCELVGDVRCEESVVYGIAATNASLSLDASVIGGAGQSGVYVGPGAAAVLNDVTIDRCGYNAIELRDGAYAYVRNSLISGAGIFVDGASLLDAGCLSGAGVAGHNIFRESSKTPVPCFIANFNLGQTCHADGNLWGVAGMESCPPAPGKVLNDVTTLCE